MEETSDPLVIPGWFWVMVVMFVAGVVVTLVIRRDRRSGHRSRSSSRGSRRRHATTRSRHRRTRDPFEKL